MAALVFEARVYKRINFLMLESVIKQLKLQALRIRAFQNFKQAINPKRKNVM